MNYYLTLGSIFSKQETANLLFQQYGIDFEERDGTYRGGSYFYSSTWICADSVSVESNYIPFTERYQLNNYREFQTLIFLSIVKGNAKNKKSKYSYLLNQFNKSEKILILKNEILDNDGKITNL